MTKELSSEIISNWHLALEESYDDFLDFAEGLSINRFVTEDGVRKIYFEDGMYCYNASAEVMTEFDCREAREIIEGLVECGVEFRPE